MSFNINDFYSSITTGEVVLAIRGSITSDVINNALEEIETKMDGIEVDLKIRKKIYNVLVECLQNLYHHVEDVPDEVASEERERFGILVVRKIEGKFDVFSANFINKLRIKPLKEKIEKINTLNQDELKDLYKFILNHQKLSAKGGGGLGLIDIARKTGKPLNYEFQPVNDEFCLFKLEVEIS